MKKCIEGKSKGGFYYSRGGGKKEKVPIGNHSSRLFLKGKNRGETFLGRDIFFQLGVLAPSIYPEELAPPLPSS